jgi:hypothetical protein
LASPDYAKYLAKEFGGKYRNVKGIYNQYLFDYQSNRICSLKIAFFDSNGDVIDQTDSPDSEWVRINSGSIYDNLFKRIFTYAQKNL